MSASRLDHVPIICCLSWSPGTDQLNPMQKTGVASHRYYSRYSVVKSRIRETKHLSTDADSSTDTTVGWTKNTQKPNFFEKRKKSSKTQKLKTA